MAEQGERDDRIRAIGEKIRALRKASGYNSYETFAYDHGLPRMQYWRMEKGTNCTLQNLFKILDIHQISLEEFFNGFSSKSKK